MLRKRRVLGAAIVAATGLALVTGWSAGAEDSIPDRGLYEVRGDTATIGGTGVDVLGVRDGVMEVIASPTQADDLRERGLALELTGDVDALLDARSGGASRAADFPAGDEGYHTYDELVAEVRAAASDHADITALSSIGTSHEGRDLPIIKISDNAAADEDEPEVLFTCNMHAREHLTTEMCLRIVSRFTDGYGSDQTVTGFVDSREIYVIPTQNPDGAEFDISGGEYQGWRKNRQPNSDGTVGRTSTATSPTSGAAAAVRAGRRRRRPTGARRPRRPPRCRPSRPLWTRGWSAVRSRSRRTSTSTRSPSWCCGRSGTPTIR